MQEYLDNGVRLGWLIEPKHKTVEIYLARQSVEILINPNTSVVKAFYLGFVLDLEPI